MNTFLNNIFNLEGKVSAVTGAGGYLCGEMARGFARAGCKVAILDLRLEKEFRFGRIAFAVFGDAYNVFNSNKSTEVYTNSSNPSIEFEKIEAIQDPRIFQIGARFEF